MEQTVDEEEHSGEMQYPYIAKVVNDVVLEQRQQRGSNGGEDEACGNYVNTIKILPIVVGAINGGKEESFGRLLSPYLSDRGIFTVISSDFCHCK